MNFPGLEWGWNSFHSVLKQVGVIRPWDLLECQEALEKRKERVLVVASTALGDSLLCTPLLKSLSDALGPERVGFLVRPAYRELYDGVPWIGRVHTVPGKFRGFGELRSELQANPYGIALVANTTDPDLVPWLWWCGVRGFFRYRTRWSHWAPWFANRSQMREWGHSEYATGHAIENNLSMAEALEIPITTRSLTLPLPSIGRPLPAYAPHLLVVHPGASRVDKRWPLDRWARVIQALLQSFHLECVLTGTREEVELANTLSEMIDHPVINLAGELGLGQMAHLLHGASLFLSGDTGPYHLAVAMECPTVTLFAPRDRGSSVEACGPHGVDLRRHRICQTKQFGDPILMIDVEEVGLAAYDILSTL